MVFKHGLVPLEVHSWLTANLAATLARMKHQTPETQALSWYYGLVHDAGVLSLKPGFVHTKVTENEVKLLLSLIEGWYKIRVEPPLKMLDIVNFAHLHAESHGDKSAGQELREEFGDHIPSNVTEADWISTGREKLGFQNKALPIFRSYTTEYMFDTPFRRHNIACFMEHTTRMNKFKEMLRARSNEIREELRIPAYDPVIAESTWAIEYYLSDDDHVALKKEIEGWLETRKASGSITAETRRGMITIHTSQKSPSPSVSCFLCGRDGRFYKGISDTPDLRERKKALRKEGAEGQDATIHIGRGDVSRVLGFELDTWRGERDGTVRYQDHRLGVCDECASALNNNKPQLEGLLIYMPRAEDVFEYYTDTLCQRKLRQWEERSLQGLCSPDPRFFDLSYWKSTEEYSQTLGGLEERRARYERALQIFDENCMAFGAENKGAYASVDLTREVSQTLADSPVTLAPMSYGCVKTSGKEQVVVNGFSFKRHLGALVLGLIMNGVKLKSSSDFSENIKSLSKRVEGLSIADLDLIVSDYERVVEAASM